MKAEFLKDDNGNIWFFYATNIQVRSRIKKETTAGGALDIAKAKINEEEEREDLEEEL